MSSFAKSNSTSSQMQQTKDQGPDPNQFLCKEQINFFPDAADQRPDANQFLCKERVKNFQDAADQRPSTRS
jgi:hypothetical protein